MSEKKSFIIIAIVLAMLIVGVYHYSAPNGPIHLAPMLGNDESAPVSRAGKDTTLHRITIDSPGRTLK